MSPRSKKQFEELREKSKAVIMEKALELFAHQGFHNTSISQIAKEAGVSKGLMYNYFESKDDLLDALIFGAVDESVAVLEESFLEHIPPETQLRRIIEGTFAMIQQNFSHWKLLTMLSFQSEVNQTLQAKLAHIKQANTDKFIELMAKMGVENPFLESYFIGAAMDGALVHWMQLGDAYPHEDMKNHMIERFCKPRNTPPAE